MTDLKNSIPSSESDTAEILQIVSHDSAPENATRVDVEETELRNVPYVVKKPHANSKLILQNMEEVLNSVKKKHRQKHRRKKEQRKLAQMELAAAEAGVISVGTVQHRLENGHKHGKAVKRHHKKPLQEKTPQENGLNHTKAKVKLKQRKSPLKGAADSSTNSLLNHFQRTPKKNGEEAVDDDDDVQLVDNSEMTSSVKSTVKPTNAFEIMMNARNRSIGSNTPGIEAASSSPADVEDAVTTTKVKRKLLLQEWAEKKGGAKRKLEEDERATYVDKQLDKRAKRFKEMLVNGNSPKATAKGTPTEKQHEIHKENASQKDQKDTSTCKNTEEPACSGRGRRRVRRISSIDSVESVGTVMDAETSEFLSKLSSPTKKRDSLLGYFEKKCSPQDMTATISKQTATVEVIETSVETPSTRPRRSKIKRTAETNSVVIMSSTAVEQATAIVPTDTLSENEVADIDTARGRPRRSCANKARYDYDLEKSPTKLEKSIRKAIKPNTPQVSTNSSIEIITLDDSNCDSSTAPQTPLKLAPLFVRNMPKPSPDPESLRARHQFLMSGVPEKVRLEQVKQKQFEQNYEESLQLFPSLSHVQQLSQPELQLLQQSKAICTKFKLCAEEDCNEASPVNASRRSGKAKVRCAITNCSAKDFHPPAQANCKVANLLAQHWPLPALENKRAVIKTWKAEFERFPTYKCYNQLREKYRYFSAIDSAQNTEQVTESFVVTRRTRRSLASQQKFDPDAEEEKPPMSAPNGELLFTEKYKPLMFEQVLVNLTPVTQLREFLGNWSTDGSARNSQTLDDSMDSANDSGSNQQPSGNAVVLLGPVSSGKTSAVYALANEMNFNVLEINAGMKRTGKKLIQELQEATQSHQIRKETSAVRSKAQQNLRKMSLNGLISKKPSAQSLDAASESCSSSSSSLELSQSTRKCLILIEDADIVFDQTDAGFTDAVYTLAASSKRPLIVVATNPHCAHLQRLINQNTINFTAPHALNISRFLTVLSLMENCPVSLDDLVSLYLYNGKDLRKTLLELQFFVQSGGDQCTTPKAKVATTSKQAQPPAQQSAAYFASPNKRRFSEDPQAPQLDEQLDNNNKDPHATRQQCAKQQLYMHRTLFEFYTMAQNEQCRIPFPVDFRLLRSNLQELLQVARKLKVTPAVEVANSGTKRKSRSPKKAWLSSAVTANSKTKRTDTPLDALCNFYEHISVAALLSARDEDAFVLAENHTELRLADGLVPHLAEQIAHTMVEQAVAVHLAADACPYNLFDTPQETHTLCDNLGAMTMRTLSARCLDYEPSLRAICRSEKQRSAMERRSTRFYHYLRNSSVNMCSFSMQQYDAACDILQEATCVSDEQSEQQTST